MEQRFRLGETGSGSGVDFQVSGVHTKATPPFKPVMRYQCFSPIVVSTLREDGSVAYLSPEDTLSSPESHYFFPLFIHISSLGAFHVYGFPRISS